MSVLIFANPYSGRGRNDRSVAGLEAALAARGLVPRVCWTLDERLAALASPGDSLASDPPLRCVVAAGGDGSIAGVINAMHRAGRLDVPFATLPMGTENLFARQFGYWTDAQRIADAIARGETLPVDLGAAGPEGAEERLFTLMTSAGFDADIVHRLDRWRTANPDGTLRRVGRTSYLPRIAGSMLNYRFPLVALDVDGRTVEGAQAYVFNLPQYGANLGIGRHARADDGLLDWVVFKKPGFVNFLGYHGLVFMGCRHLRCASVAHGRAKRVTLRSLTDHHLPAQIDGDPAGHTPVEVRIRPGVLRVIRVG